MALVGRTNSEWRTTTAGLALRGTLEVANATLRGRNIARPVALIIGFRTCSRRSDRAADLCFSRLTLSLALDVSQRFAWVLP